MPIRGLGGARLPTAFYALRPNLEFFFFFLPFYGQEGSILFVVCFLHASRRYTFDLDIESTRGQPASCWARPVNIDDHLETSMLILRTLLKRAKTYFCHRRGIEIFGRLLSTHERPNVFFSDAWQAPATYHRSSCEHCVPRVGRGP